MTQWVRVLAVKAGSPGHISRIRGAAGDAVFVPVCPVLGGRISQMMSQTDELQVQ